MNLRPIIEAGILAPSGDNCQPWRFRLADGVIDVFLVPERDTSLYSWGHRPSLVAVGAAIENMIIAANHYGYNTDVDLFPRQGEENLIASMALRQKEVKKDEPLFTALHDRCTNRKAYKNIPLTEAQKAIFREAANAITKHNFHLVEDQYAKSRIGKAVALNEKILFENKFLHQFFYNHISWTRKQEEEKRLGFYIKELEIPAPIRPLFRLFGNWKLIEKMQMVGIGDLIAKGNSRIYMSGAAIGCITVDANTPEEFVTAGRAFERVWLTVTQLKLYLQPMTGIFFLMQRVRAGDDTHLSDAHQKIVRDAYNEIEKSFNLEGRNKVIIAAFRIGHAPHPSARSLRLEPEVIYEN